MSDPHVAFVVGCARSGTSILGELIAAHPQVTAYSEFPYEYKMAGYWLHVLKAV